MFGAYGKHRRTYVFVHAKTGLSTVRFTAELTEVSQWQLDFYSPYDVDHDLFERLVFEFAISTKSQAWNASLQTTSLTPGWNLVGDFDLPAGEVFVDFISTSKPGFAFADAIRWTKR